MRWVVLVLMLVAMPVQAQLEPGEDGCQTWVESEIADSDDWVYRSADPDSIGGSSGVHTPDARIGDEYALIEQDFGRSYVVRRITVEMLFGEFEDGDTLEIYLPDTALFHRFQPLGEYGDFSPFPPDYFTVVWEGNTVASSVGIYLRANTETTSRARIADVTICVDETTDVTNLALVMREVFASPLAIVAGVMMAFLLLMGMANVLYKNFMPD